MLHVLHVRGDLALVVHDRLSVHTSYIVERSIDRVVLEIEADDL